MLGLAHLPVLPDALTFQVLAEPADLVGDGFVRRRPRQEPADPTDAVGRRLFLHQPRLEDELPKLLQRRF